AYAPGYPETDRSVFRPQVPSQNLAARRHRQFILIDDRPRVEIERQPLLDVRLQFGCELIGSFEIWCENDVCAHGFASELIGDTDGRSHGNRWVCKQALLDLTWPNTITGRRDDVIGSAFEPEVAHFVAAAQITGVNQAAITLLAGLLRLVPIPEDLPGIRG